MAKIYVASSWKNEHQQKVVAFLREYGHEVFDFKNRLHSVRVWPCTSKSWEQWSIADYRHELDRPVMKEVFDSDFCGMKWADVCVLVLPCGRSAHTEAGWMKGAGKKVFVYQPVPQEPELMYNIYDGIYDNMYYVDYAIRLWKC
jgi:hypothetical protein